MVQLARQHNCNNQKHPLKPSSSLNHHLKCKRAKSLRLSQMQRQSQHLWSNKQIHNDRLTIKNSSQLLLGKRKYLRLLSRRNYFTQWLRLNLFPGISPWKSKDQTTLLLCSSQRRVSTRPLHRLKIIWVWESAGSKDRKATLINQINSISTSLKPLHQVLEESRMNITIVITLLMIHKGLTMSCLRSISLLQRITSMVAGCRDRCFSLPLPRSN